MAEKIDAGEKKDSQKKSKAADEPQPGALKTKADLKTFLLNIRDKMTEDAAAPVFAVSAMRHILTTPNIDDLMNKENKEIARDIWLRIKQAGFQMRNPGLLFSPDEELPPSAGA